MKQIITLMLFLLITTVVTSQDKNHSTENTQQVAVQKPKDSIKKAVAYKVLYASPTLKYSVTKRGEGDNVLFSIRFRKKNLPRLIMTPTSGTPYYSLKKKGFENVYFPFKCTIDAFTNYTVSSFDDRALLMNGFEIIIYEPGNWDIVFD